MGELRLIRQQQSQEGTLTRHKIRLLHPSDCKLDGGSTKKISKSQNSRNENRLQISLPQGDSPLRNSVENCNTTPRRSGSVNHSSINFGGAPCPFEWGVISESICDLANELVQCNDWDPADLHASVQKDIPPPQFLDDDIPFAEGRELIVDILVNPRGKADVYIDNTTGLTVDIPGSRNIRDASRRVQLPAFSLFN